MRWPSFRRRDRDLDDEIRSHLDLAERDRVAGGEAPAAARAAARREFGNVALVKEIARDVRAGASLAALGRDTRYGLRLLARSPALAAAAVISLALGIGANIAIFTVADALLLRPLPVHDPSGLFALCYSDAPTGEALFSYPAFEKYRDLQGAFAGIAAVSDLDRSGLTLNGPAGAVDPGRTRVSLVSGAFFPTLGLAPAAGRLLSADDDRTDGTHPVAAASAAFVARYFARPGDAVGRTLTLNGVAYTIVGVATPHFTGVSSGQPIDVWIPIAMEPAVWAERPGLLTNPNPAWVRIVVRLADGVSAARADAAASAVFLTGRGPLDPRLTAAERQAIADVRLTLQPIGTAPSAETAAFARPLAIVGVVVGLVLVIACSNVANLLLARSAARRQEFAVRMALGASAFRIARQLLAESVVIAAGGGVLGALGAWWGARALAAMLRSGLTPIDVDVSPDWRVVGFALAVTTGAGLAFGLGPALRASRGETARDLGARRPGGGPSRRYGVPEGLVVAQVAVSIVLLAGAGLFIQTVRNLRSQDLGFDREHVLLAWVPVGETGASGAAVAGVFRGSRDRAEALPGVVSAAASSEGLLGGEAGGSPVTVPGHVRTDDEDFFVPWNLITPRFFETVGQRQVAGRDFTPGDDEHAPRVAIINESMARYYWGRVDVVGERFGMRRDTGNEIEIVGVVADAAADSPRTKPTRMIYLPYRQDLSHLRDLCLMVRTVGDPEAAAPLVRSALRAVDPALPVTSITSMRAQLDRALADERLVAGLTGAFGLIGLLLTSVGLFGVVSYATARRTNEIGIRLALGAPRAGVVGGVVGASLTLAAGGAAVGVPAALALSRLVSARLFGIAAADPRAIGTSALVMLAVAGLSSVLPAARAARVEPVAALRTE